MRIAALGVGLLMAGCGLSAYAQQTCPSTQTMLNFCLTPKRTTVEQLPPAVQLRNAEPVTIHVSNMSPLESCKLTSTTFTAVQPASAAQQAVTALAAISPFGVGASTLVGGLLTSQGAMNLMAGAKNNYELFLKTPEGIKSLPPGVRKPPGQRPIDLATDAIAKANGLIDDLIGPENTDGKEQMLLAMQAARQQDGIALAAMYSAFQIADFRKPESAGTFDQTYGNLNKAFHDFLEVAIPGQGSPVAGDYSVISVDPNLYRPIPVTGPGKYAPAGTITDLQKELTEAKTYIAQARAAVDKDDTAKNHLAETFATLDGRYSAADNGLTKIGQNDTALRIQQSSLQQLATSLDQLGRAAKKNGVWITSMDLPAPATKNGTVSGSVTCFNRLDNTKVTLDPMPYSVTYQVVPRLFLSAGVLFSPIAERTIGTDTVKTGVDATGTATTQDVVSVSNGASAQVVPFSFLNLRLGNGWSYRSSDPVEMAKHSSLAKRVFMGGLSGGFGVNPNSGSTNPEFFAGLFGAVDRFTLHLGTDWGRLQTLGGGFAPGDVVPSGTTVPTSTHFVKKLAVGLSVRLYP